MTSNKIYLVRHGENLANIRVMLSSRKVDYPLNERGRLQAEQTADYFRSSKIDEVYASPLKRAVETAQIIAAPHDLLVNIRENFREIYTGVLEDRPDSVESWRGWHQVTRAWIDGLPGTRFPGGEDHFMVRERMRLGLEEILDGKNGRTILIVSHIGLLTATITEICPEVSPAEIIRKETQNCAIAEVEMTCKDGRWTGKLVRWGDFSHLHGEAAKFTPPLMQMNE
jgi:broad specificity phosphatase PhoE